MTPCNETGRSPWGDATCAKERGHEGNHAGQVILPDLRTTTTYQWAHGASHGEQAETPAHEVVK